MYYIGILIYMGLIGLLFNFSTAMRYYIDFPSLVVIIGLTVPILLASGLWIDFIKGFKMMGEKVNSFSLIEVKRISVAVRLVMKTMLLSGLLGTMSGVVAILANFDAILLLWPSFSVALITLIYAVVLTFLLLPVDAKAKAIIAAMA